MLRYAKALLLAAVLAAPALAQRVTEPTTGLAVQPPPGYGAAVMAAQPPNIAAIVIRRPQDRDTGCQVAFRPAPANAPFSQAELNTAIASRTWRDELTRTLSTFYSIEHTEAFQHDGLEGFLLEGMVRIGPATPSRAKDVRTLFAIMETPRGRTSVVCVGERADFAARRIEFLAVVRATTAPAQPATVKP